MKEKTSSSQFKVGDIVGDRFERIRIENVSITTKIGKTHISYSGPLLTKKNEPRVDGKKRVILQESIKFFKCTEQRN